MRSAAVLIEAPGNGSDQGTDANPRPRYSIVLSNDLAEIEAAQRLRYQVFAEEMKAPLPHAARGPLTGELVDDDGLDPYCDHLVARLEPTGEVVGCCRLLTPDGCRAAGGAFTDSMFDASALAPLRPELCEIGRVTVASAHRSGAVMAMLWTGIMRYQQMTGYRWGIGCLSVRMEADGPRGGLVKAVHEFARRHAAPEKYRVVPRNPVSVNGISLDELPGPGRIKLPPLLHGCLRLGGRICGAPSYDPDFDMADFLVLISREMVHERYLQWLDRSDVLR